MTRTYKIVLGIGITVLLGIGAFVLLKKYYFEPTITNEPIITTNTPPVTVENPTTTNSNLKTYRNEEWGFEFGYPSNLILKEKVFGGYYSQFNLEIFLQKKGLDSVFLLNIVLPEFIDGSFGDIKDGSFKIVIDGIEGEKYEYDQGGFSHTAIILPLNNLKIILATGDGSKPYIEELNQILSSFRFIKK